MKYLESRELVWWEYYYLINICSWQNPIIIFINQDRCFNFVLIENNVLYQKVPAFAIVEFKSADTARSVATYGQHVINSQRIEIRPRTFKELRTEPYFPWQREDNNRDLPWQKYNELHQKLSANNIQMGPYEATQPRRKGKIKGPAPIKQGRAKDSEGQDIVPIDVKEFQTYLEQHQCVGVRLPTIL